mmetsp:Transcript_72974/g.188238  ORF Transcript_72974/g.188238 Transcript_72974/m.188238 type:complete len:212 (+) Transcript_72974:558-1193(+)
MGMTACSRVCWRIGLRTLTRRCGPGQRTRSASSARLREARRQPCRIFCRRCREIVPRKCGRSASWLVRRIASRASPALTWTSGRAWGSSLRMGLSAQLACSCLAPTTAAMASTAVTRRHPTSATAARSMEPGSRGAANGSPSGRRTSRPRCSWASRCWSCSTRGRLARAWSSGTIWPAWGPSCGTRSALEARRRAKWLGSAGLVTALWAQM